MREYLKSLTRRRRGRPVAGVASTALFVYLLPRKRKAMLSLLVDYDYMGRGAQV